MHYPDSPTDAADCLNTLCYARRMLHREVSQIKRGYHFNARHAPKQIEKRELHIARLTHIISAIRAAYPTRKEYES